MRLWLLHPKWAGRSCRDCVQFIYSDEGELRRWPDGSPKKRPRGTVLPCAGCPKIPHGIDPSPRNASELDDRLWLTYQFYRECRAVTDWPKDPIVRWAAKIIRDVEDEAEKSQENDMLTLLLTRK